MSIARRSVLLALAAAGLMGVGPSAASDRAMKRDDPLAPPKRKPGRDLFRRLTGRPAITGLRQGARLERQMRAGLLDFSASERCIAAIRARQEARR